MYMENTIVRQHMTIGLPAPRRAMQIWDIDPVDAAPGPWAPANATVYSHIATDMPRLSNSSWIWSPPSAAKKRQEMMQYESMIPIYTVA